MRLFYHPFSANSRRVLMTAAHLGIELELVKVDLPKGQHVSLADLSLAAPLAFAQQAAVPIAGLPNVALWLERVQALDAWQKTLPR